MIGLNSFNNCGNCKFWSKKSDYLYIDNEGVCNEIKEKLYFDIEGEGSLNVIETEESFCCSLHETKK